MLPPAPTALAANAPIMLKKKPKRSMARPTGGMDGWTCGGGGACERKSGGL
jgi:hypothetical protein